MSCVVVVVGGGGTLVVALHLVRHLSGVRDEVQTQLLLAIERRGAHRARVPLVGSDSTHTGRELSAHSSRRGSSARHSTHLHPGAASHLVHQEILLPEVTLPTLEATERPLPCVPPVTETRETPL